MCLTNYHKSHTQWSWQQEHLHLIENTFKSFKTQNSHRFSKQWISNKLEQTPPFVTSRKGLVIWKGLEIIRGFGRPEGPRTRKGRETQGRKRHEKYLGIVVMVEECCGLDISAGGDGWWISRDLSQRGWFSISTRQGKYVI